MFAASFSIAQDSTHKYILKEVLVSDSLQKSLNSRLFNLDDIDKRELKTSYGSSALTSITANSASVYVTRRTNAGFGVGPGSVGNISIRGLGSSPNTQILVLIDGTPQYMGLMGHPLADTYSKEKISSIEVITGPASVIYGNGAFGGTLNIKTDRIYKKGLQANIRAGAGSFNNYSYSASIDYSTGNYSLSTGFKQNGTDGHREYSNYLSKGIFLKSRYFSGDDFSLSFFADYTDYKVYDPGPVNNKFSNHWIDVQRTNAVINAEKSFSFGVGSAKLFYNYGKHDLYYGFKSDDFSTGIKLLQSISISDNSILQIGADYNFYSGEAENKMKDFGENSIYESAVYALIVQKISDKFEMKGGLRLVDNEIFGGSVIPHLGMEYSVSPKIKLGLDGSKGYRNPTIRELYLFPFPSPELDPENIWNLEASVAMNLSARLNGKLTLFNMNGENIIAAVKTPLGMKYDNSGNFESTGVEGNIEYLLNSNLDLKLNFSVLNPDKITAGFPQQRYILTSRYLFNRFLIEANFQINKDIYAENNHLSKLSDYNLLNLYIQYTLLMNSEIYISFENLLDEDYEIIKNYPMPGITIEAGFRLKI